MNDGRGGLPEAAELEHLLARHAKPGPRYTSYPAVPIWTSTFDAERHETALAECGRSGPVSIYAHVPFCASLCHFCACNRVITRDAKLVDRYLDGIDAEVARSRSVFSTPPSVAQLHWGGGTPTHLEPAQIERLFRTLTDAFPLTDDAEVSIEVDPRVTTEGQLDVLANLGFDRISLGVQDTSERTQHAIHRVQPFETTRRVTDEARARGITGVNFDLVYGLPHQTKASFRKTIEEILTLAPDRIALYGYAHVTWVAKQQRGFERMDLPDATSRLQIQLQAIEQLTDAGYHFIGMDHFARPDDELSQALEQGTLRRNFMGYTTLEGLDTIAFGPSAISELPSAYAQSHKDLKQWFERVERGALATERGHTMTADDLARRDLIWSVMCGGRVRRSELEARHGRFAAVAMDGAGAALGELEADGLVECSRSGDLQVTETGRLFLRVIAMAFDAYLEPAGAVGADRPRYSQTV